MLLYCELPNCLFEDLLNSIIEGFYTEAVFKPVKPAFICVCARVLCVCIGSGRPHPTTCAGCAWQSGQTRGPQCTTGTHYRQPELPTGGEHTHTHTHTYNITWACVHFLEA